MMVFLVLLDITPYLASLHCSLQLLSQSLEDEREVHEMVGIF